MPRYQWPTDTMQVAAELGDEAGRYASWAVSTVDGLYYLDDVDQGPERLRWIDAGHPDDAIDMAHVRWAASTAMTALDLCAAALGELHGVPVYNPGPPSRAHDIETLRDHRKQLCDGCRTWLSGVVGDNSYRVLKSLRDPMAHRTLPRRFSILIGGALTDAQRLAFLLPGAKHDQDHTLSRPLIENARDTARKHVLALITAARAGALQPPSM